jgi:hypothetical protein
MKCNIGYKERYFRIIAGIILIALTYTHQIGNWGWWIGILLLVTGLIRFCPAYLLFKR